MIVGINTESWNRALSLPGIPYDSKSFFSIIIFIDTTTDGLGVALSFYGGLYAYNGWYNIVQVTEEIKNPKRSVPIAAVLSVTIVTVLYILTNISYYIIIGHKKVGRYAQLCVFHS